MSAHVRQDGCITGRIKASAAFGHDLTKRTCSTYIQVCRAKFWGPGADVHAPGARSKVGAVKDMGSSFTAWPRHLMMRTCSLMHKVQMQQKFNLPSSPHKTYIQRSKSQKLTSLTVHPVLLTWI
eukprot:1012159-Pelagomonas_calceolata.AAC.2